MLRTIQTDRRDTQLTLRWLMFTWLGRAAWAVQVLAGSRRQRRCGRHCLPYLRLWLSRSPVYSLWLCEPWSSLTLILCVNGVSRGPSSASSVRQRRRYGLRRFRRLLSWWGKFIVYLSKILKIKILKWIIFK